ncbi:MAG: quinoprotein relay system zinc metallohydrolase 1 [Gammaproteobacteria bacterium]|nr:quinoprotein relay system zinc metallohydrolase 1 [Gammaproteobacteria bacterium]
MVSGIQAAGNYHLKPEMIAPGTYVLSGRNEHFNFRNGGNIVNTGFIVTKQGVVVIDTGPSRIYGEQMRAAIAGITDQPIISVLNTHLHPDHFLGNQAFEDIPIGALPGTIEGIRTQGEMFNDSMYRLAGSWMAGTRVVIPGETLKPGTLEVGGHRLRLLALDGHTSADLVILDETTGVLFASDIVFNSRTPTTPHADVGRWLKALDRLASIEFDILVPGHGRVESGAKRFEPVIQTGKYLGWLSGTLSTAAEAGKSMAEVLHPDVPQWVAGQAVFPEEYQRSVVHLFPDYESAALQRGLVEQQ